MTFCAGFDSAQGMKQAIGIALELGEEDLLAELVTAAKENASVCSETSTYVCVNMLYVGGCVCGGEWHV